MKYQFLRVYLKFGGMHPPRDLFPDVFGLVIKNFESIHDLGGYTGASCII